MLVVFFTIVYFICFWKIIDVVLCYTPWDISFLNLVGVICLFIAFLVSIGLACYTVKKIEKKYSK